MIILLVACVDSKESTKQTSPDCDSNAHTLTVQPPPGWQLGTPCEQGCSPEDEGLALSTCYTTTDNLLECQYGEYCPD
jgi:hypothetical protein